MFARLAALSTLAFAVLASAHAGHDVCNTGSLQCCNAVADVRLSSHSLSPPPFFPITLSLTTRADAFLLWTQSQSSQGNKILSLVGVAVDGVTGLVGVNCTPITALVGVSISQSCTAHPVCCSDSSAVSPCLPVFFVLDCGLCRGWLT